MLVVISDTCVLIDIESSDLSSAIFNLPYQFMIPDIMFYEELANSHGHLLQSGLVIKTMSSEQISEVIILKATNLKPSLYDLLAFVLAKSEACQLLTGDKALRQLAEKSGVEVHGTIWLIEQLLLQEIISVDVATIAFEKMKKAGSHQPWDEVEKMLIRHKTSN